MRYFLSVLLHSDTTFGRGEGVAGLVDVEIEHDSAGCPFLGGRALKGLLRESWYEIRDALARGGNPALAMLEPAAARLLGESGADFDGSGSRAALMRVQAATLPPALRDRLHRNVAAGTIRADEVLASLTTIRRQTALDAARGAPEIGSLRAMRVLLRDTRLLAGLDFAAAPAADDLALLAACALGVRRAGTTRNRGRGRVSLLLHDSEPANYADSAFTLAQFQHFAALVKGVPGHAAA